jgi:hypothetical protein
VSRSAAGSARSRYATRSCRRAAATISACRLPPRAGTYSSGRSASGVAGTPLAASTVASAAGPHWSVSSGKNGTCSSSAPAATSRPAIRGAAAQPASSAQRPRTAALKLS